MAPGLMESMESAIRGSGLSTLEREVSSMWRESNTRSFGEIAIDKLINIWGEQALNLEVIDIDCKVGMLQRIVYGNLYSYVLMNGIVVPYCDWVYDSIYYDSGQDVSYYRNGSGDYKRQEGEISIKELLAKV